MKLFKSWSNSTMKFFLKKIKLVENYIMDTKEINLQLRKKVGDKIQLLRKNESYEKIAARCNLDASKISKIEKGQVDFRINTIFEIAKGLRVHPKELLDIKFSFEDYYKEIDYTYKSTL